MKKIYLDDKRNPSDYYLQEWFLVKNYQEFIDIVNSNKDIEYISFDHDLGEEKSGYDCLKYLIDNDIYIPKIIVHTDNNPGGENIETHAKNWHKFLISENILKEEDCLVLRARAMFVNTKIDI